MVWQPQAFAAWQTLRRLKMTLSLALNSLALCIAVHILCCMLYIMPMLWCVIAAFSESR